MYLGIGVASCSPYAKDATSLLVCLPISALEKFVASEQPFESASQGGVSSGSAHFIAISKR